MGNASPEGKLRHKKFPEAYHCTCSGWRMGRGWQTQFWKVLSEETALAEKPMHLPGPPIDIRELLEMPAQRRAGDTVRHTA